jgi:hypothetical protein
MLAEREKCTTFCGKFVTESPSSHRSRVGFVLAFVWLLLASGGLWVMAKHQFAPGAPASSGLDWPAGTQIQRATDRPTLVLFAHPRCPCTRASIAELGEITARCGDHLAVRVLFYKPLEFPSGWEKADLWRSASAIPGASVFSDVDGAAARAFGGLTSGQALLYGADGRLLFRGGITQGRGHAGDNPGRASILSLVSGGAGAFKATPVFGCPIEKPDESRSAEAGPSR